VSAFDYHSNDVMDPPETNSNKIRNPRDPNYGKHSAGECLANWIIYLRTPAKISSVSRRQKAVSESWTGQGLAFFQQLVCLDL
jgi:hypothetical protein